MSTFLNQPTQVGLVIFTGATSVAVEWCFTQPAHAGGLGEFRRFDLGRNNDFGQFLALRFNQIEIL